MHLSPPTRPFSQAFPAAQLKERAARRPVDWQRRKAYQWAVALVAGISSGCMAFALNWVTEALVSLKGSALMAWVQPGGGFFRPWLAYTGVASLYAGLAGLLVSRVAPMAAGSGIPHMRSWINGVDVPRCVAPATLVVKCVGVTLAIASGLVAGKEGPYIQSGGIIGYLTGCSGNAVARRWALRRLRGAGGRGGVAPRGGPPPPPPRAWLGGWARALGVVEPREASDYASVGTSAGVAVAFNAPVAGVAYAAEEGNTVYSVSMLWKAVFSAGGAICTMQLLDYAAKYGAGLGSARMELSNTLTFRLTNSVWAAFWYHAWEVPLFCLLGAAFGLLGAGWTAACIQCLKLRGRFIPERRKLARNAETVVVAAITATVWLTMCYCSPCKPLPASAARLDEVNRGRFSSRYFDSPGSMWPRLWCPGDKEYSSWGQLFAMPVEGAVRALMTAQPLLASDPAAAGDATAAGDESFAFDTVAMAAFFGCALLGLLLAYGVAAPTGIFIPTMAIGAAGGRLWGRAVMAALQAAGLNQQVSLPAYAAVGAAALLAGHTRLLLSTILIVSETSGSGPVLVPMVLACVASKLVADSLTPCVYDWQIEHAGILFLEDSALLHPRQMQALSTTQVCDVMTKEPLAALPLRPRLRDLIWWLQRHPYSFVPIVRALGTRGTGGDAASRQGGLGAEPQPAAAEGPASCGFTKQQTTAATATEPAAAAAAAVATVKGKEEAALGGEEVAGGAPAWQELPPAGRELLGVVFRWQLLSCLEHPALLHAMEAADGDGGDNGSGDNGALNGPTAAGANGKPLARPPPGANGAGAWASPESGGCGEHGDRYGSDGGGGERDGGGVGGDGDVAVRLPLPSGWEGLGAADRAALLIIMAQGPPNETPDRAAAEEERLLQWYLRPPPAGGDAAGGGGDDGGREVAEELPAARDEERGPAEGAAAGVGSGSESEPALSRRVDLSPLLQQCYFDLPPDATLGQAHSLMRHLGAHSIAVQERGGPRLLGVLTRRDVAAAEEGKEEH